MSFSRRTYVVSTLLVFVAVLIFSPFIGQVRATDVSGDVNVNTVWDLAGSPYYLTGDVRVNSTATLTIESGVEVYSNGNYRIEANGGTIDINGVDGSPVIFEHATSTSPGSWQGIYVVDGGSAFVDWAEIRYADFGVKIYNTSSSAEVRNSIIEDNDSGIEVFEGGSLTTQSNAFNRNTDFPLIVNPDAGSIDLGNGGADSLGSGADANGYDAIGYGYSDDYALCPGNSCSFTVQSFGGIPNIPYVQWHNYSFNDADDTFTVGPGVVIKGRVSYRTLQFQNGADLIIDGDAGNEVVMTVIADDANGGDSNNDGTGSSPSADSFNGIKISDGGTANIEYTKFLYHDVALEAYGAGTSLDVRHSNFEDNMVGLEVHDEASLTTQANKFYRNQDFPLVLNPDVGTITLGDGGVDEIGVDADENGYNAIGFGYSDSVATCPGNNCSFIQRDFAGISNIPYVLWDNYTVNNSADTLTFNPGVIVKGRLGYRRLFVDNGASLVIDGDFGNEVTITADEHDIGNDSNNDGTGSSPSAGDFQGIAVAGGGTASVEYANIYYSDYGIKGSESGTNLNISNCLFADNEVGVEVHDEASLTTQSNKFYRNTIFPIVLNPDVGTIALGSGGVDEIGVDANENGYNAIGFGKSDTAATCPSNSCVMPQRSFAGISNIPYVLWDQYLINNPADTLTINPGVIVKTRLSYRGLIIDNGASLFVDGDDGNEVTITADEHDIGNDSNNDGTGSSPSAGDAQGIIVRDGSSAIAEYTNFYYNDNAFRGMGTGTLLDAANNLFDTNEVGIEVHDEASLTTQSNTFHRNTHVPIALNPDVGIIDLGNGGADILGDTESTKNAYNAIGIGHSDTTATCPSNNCVLPQRNFAGITNIPYLVWELYSVNDGAYTFTINPGVIIKGRVHYRNINVDNGASLIVDGDPGNEVILTSQYDDSHGGDTNNDGTATSASPGDFNGFEAIDGSSISIENTEIYYNGVGLRGHGTGTSITATSNLFSDNEVGIEIYEDADLTTQSNTFYRNTIVPLVLNPDVGTINLGSGGDDILGDTEATENANDGIGFAYTDTVTTCPGNVCSLPQRNFAGISNIPYIQWNGLRVSNSGDIFTIDEGVLIKSRTTLPIEIESGASLDVNGVYGNEVIYTALEDDDHGGDTNNDGTISSPASGGQGQFILRGAGSHRVNFLNTYYASVGMRVDGATDVIIEDSDFLNG